MLKQKRCVGKSILKKKPLTKKWSLLKGICDTECFDKLVRFVQDSNDKQTKKLKLHIEKEVAEIRKEINEEKQKRIQLEEENKQLKDKCLALDKSLRKNNIIIFGVECTEDKSVLDITLETLNTHLNLNLNKHDINNAFGVGKQNQN